MLNDWFPHGVPEWLSTGVGIYVAGGVCTVLLLVFGACRRALHQRAIDRWIALWLDAAERANKEGVPFTEEDSIADINDRINRAREEKTRGKVDRG